jgi:hypothetical protein
LEKIFARGGGAGQLSTAGPFVASMAHAAARLKASGMGNYRHGTRTKEMIEVCS